MCSIDGVIYLCLMGLGLGSVVWDATVGWSCDKITPCSEPLPRLASLAIAHGWGAGQVMAGRGRLRYLQCGQAVKGGSRVIRLVRPSCA